MPELLEDAEKGLPDTFRALLARLAEQLKILDQQVGELEAEIERWEARAGDDPEARAVLRAFLGLRELLWEFGIRPSGSRTGSETGNSFRSRRGTARRSRPRRVQRVEIEG